MKIYNTEYEICDTIECIGIANSFTKGSNKIGIGHGESKLYIGQISDNKILSFFDMENQRGKEFKCFILKQDLLQYPNDVRIEYENPTQEYRNKDVLKKYGIRIYYK